MNTRTKTIFLIAVVVVLLMVGGYWFQAGRPDWWSGWVRTDEQVTDAPLALDIERQEVDSLPADFFRGKESLERLNVANNNLTGSLPAEIRLLTNLTVLDASANKLTGVPAEIGQLDQLEWLDLGDNQLTALPAELANLDNLEYLALANNQFTSFPAEIMDLVNLKILNIANNPIQQLPADLSPLSKLEQLTISGGDLSATEIERIKAALPNTIVAVR